MIFHVPDREGSHIRLDFPPLPEQGMPEATALSIESPLIHETFSNPAPMHLPALHRHALIVSGTKKRTTGDSLCVF